MNKIAITLIISGLLISNNAHAYLDPGSGSMLLQVILGGIAAVGVALKLAWHKIIIFFGGSKKKSAAEESDS